MNEGHDGSAIRWVLGGIASLAIAVPAIVVHIAPAPPLSHMIRVRQHIVPRVEVPPVEPMNFIDLAPKDARAFNAQVPFVDGPKPAARPFSMPGGPEDAARATDCLAAAVLYEAGDDAIGEKAVAQVVLNRVRHPAFPKTVCGVVFQGSERSTGCQFTFTCDGALARHPSDSGWARAREIATAALTGAVYKPVGYATHYHTDCVVPYWQSSLDKIAAVHTHLFFRWTGWWGTPPAFRRTVQAGEPVIAQLAGLSDAHKTGAALAEAGAAMGEVAALAGSPLSPLASDPNGFLVTLDRTLPPDAFPAFAARACGDRLYCKFLGWTDSKKTPAALPIGSAQIATMAFSYLRDRSAGLERTLWNCQQFKRAETRQCMKVQVLSPMAVAPSFAPPPMAATRSVPKLDGIRRKLTLPTVKGTPSTGNDQTTAVAAHRSSPGTLPTPP